MIDTGAGELAFGKDLWGCWNWAINVCAHAAQRPVLAAASRSALRWFCQGVSEEPPCIGALFSS